MSTICTSNANDGVKDYMDVDDVDIACYEPNVNESRYLSKKSIRHSKIH